MDCCNKKEFVLRRILLRNRAKKQVQGDCNTQFKKVALIGNPNVGKSVIFNSLTGAYVTVSNYPGTTVEVSRGFYKAKDMKLEVIDTPGMYSILPITEEERVARNLLLNEKPDLIIHVIDAKNIGRMLPLTLQLIESGFPVVLVLNIMDEANSLGIMINLQELGNRLGIPVVQASAALNVGIEEIKRIVEERIHDAA